MFIAQTVSVSLSLMFNTNSVADLTHVFGIMMCFCVCLVVADGGVKDETELNPVCSHTWATLTHVSLRTLARPVLLEGRHSTRNK